MCLNHGSSGLLKSDNSSIFSSIPCHQLSTSHELYKDKIQKHFQNVMLVGMASENSKTYTYKCVDRSRHNGIKGAKAKCAH